jgi:hypothetical protein
MSVRDLMSTFAMIPPAGAEKAPSEPSASSGHAPSVDNVVGAILRRSQANLQCCTPYVKWLSVVRAGSAKIAISRVPWRTAAPS